ncbi:hypothetical protein Q7P37_004936 [Cladosporium fusiforme]
MRKPDLVYASARDKLHQRPGPPSSHPPPLQKVTLTWDVGDSARTDASFGCPATTSAILPSATISVFLGDATGDARVALTCTLQGDMSSVLILVADAVCLTTESREPCASTTDFNKHASGEATAASSRLNSGKACMGFTMPCPRNDQLVALFATLPSHGRDHGEEVHRKHT